MNKNTNDHNRPNEEINADRLCDAATAVLRAMVEYADEHRGEWPYPPDLMGAPDQPRVLCDYTRFEVEEATAFLVRMGVLELPTSQGS